MVLTYGGIYHVDTEGRGMWDSQDTELLKLYPAWCASIHVLLTFLSPVRVYQVINVYQPRRLNAPARAVVATLPNFAMSLITLGTTDGPILAHRQPCPINSYSSHTNTVSAQFQLAPFLLQAITSCLRGNRTAFIDEAVR